jgi:hypothetical protein
MLVLNIALCVFLLLSSLVGRGPGWTWQTVKVTLVPSQTRGMGAGVARRRRAMNVKRSRQSNCFLIRNSWGREQGSLVAFVATPGIYSTLLWNHPSSFCESKLSRLCCSGIKLSRKLQLLINLSKKSHSEDLSFQFRPLWLPPKKYIQRQPGRGDRGIQINWSHQSCREGPRASIDCSW